MAVVIGGGVQYEQLAVKAWRGYLSVHACPDVTNEVL